MKISVKIYREISALFMNLCLHRRWTSVVTDDTYDELAKQALNMIITFFLACEEEHAGRAVDWTMFPKIVLYRAFQRAYVMADVEESAFWEICRIGNISKETIDEITREIIAEKVDNDFANELYKAMESNEARIYKGGTKIATYIEFIENQANFNGIYAKKLEQVLEGLSKYADIAGYKALADSENPIFNMLMDISKLRNQNRWAFYARSMDCSVLGHLLDTAIYAYFMSLEEFPNDEERAAKMFFIGIFHDVAEGWTKDIPSPIKDRIPGFREASEEYEIKMLEVHMYNLLPDHLKERVKAVMMEEAENKNIKPFLKGADYLSASAECYRNIIGGTRDYNFYRALMLTDRLAEEGKIRLTPDAKEFYRHLVKETSGKIESLIFY